MKKIKITQEQAEAIERLKKEQKKSFENDKHLLLDWAESLRPLTGDEFMDALYDGYEVEPKFKVRDWVVLEDGYIGEIEFINEVEGWANIGYSKDTKERGVCLARTYDLTDIERHATPSEIAEEKERRFFARYGRKPWELFRNDILIDKHGNLHEVLTTNNKKVLFIGKGKFLSIDLIKADCKVVCFAEKRLDV